MFKNKALLFLSIASFLLSIIIAFIPNAPSILYKLAGLLFFNGFLCLFSYGLNEAYRDGVPTDTVGVGMRWERVNDDHVNPFDSDD